jgi:purine nucleoside phosphorylase
MTDRTLNVSYKLEGNWEYNETLRKSFVDFEKTYDSVRREVLYNILNEFRITTNTVTLIKICLNET